MQKHRRNAGVVPYTMGLQDRVPDGLFIGGHFVDGQDIVEPGQGHGGDVVPDVIGLSDLFERRQIGFGQAMVHLDFDIGCIELQDGDAAFDFSAGDAGLEVRLDLLLQKAVLPRAPGGKLEIPVVDTLHLDRDGEFGAFRLGTTEAGHTSCHIRLLLCKAI